MRRLILDVKLPPSEWRGMWMVEMRGYGRRVVVSHKVEAIRQAVEEARKHQAQGGIAQVVIHGRDGRIQSERTYGLDPRRRKG